MRSTNVLIVIISIFLFNCCNTNEEISESEKQIIIEELQETLDSYKMAFEKKDMEGVQNFWSDNPDFVYAGDGKLLTDYDSVISYRFPRLFKRLQKVLYFEFTNGHGAVLSKDAASIAYDFDCGYVLQSGDTVQFRGTWLFVFRKLDDQWSVVQSAGTHIIY